MAKKFFADADFQSVSRIVNLPAPSNTGDAATKGYVDSLVEGLAWKDSSRGSSEGRCSAGSALAPATSAMP